MLLVDARPFSRTASQRPAHASRPAARKLQLRYLRWCCEGAAADLDNHVAYKLGRIGGPSLPAPVGRSPGLVRDNRSVKPSLFYTELVAELHGPLRSVVQDAAAYASLIAVSGEPAPEL